MENLFWKNKDATKVLSTKEFKVEEEFEKFVFDTAEILEDVFLLKRQIRGGNKKGIPDIIGIDNDGNVCIIEMKNIPVDARIIPQVLEYAFWAETNPDSIKSLWLECDNKPDGLSISWDSFEVRIIVIAPKIIKLTLNIVNKINYPVDLVEIKRWREENNDFFLVKHLEAEKTTINTNPVSGLRIYDADFYQNQYNKQSAKEFMKYVLKVEELVQKNGWDLETKYNKHYCTFKVGFFNAFGIRWIGSKTFSFFFKLPEEQAKKLQPEMTKYDDSWDEALYYIEIGKSKVSDYEKLFEKAYRRLIGWRGGA